MKTCNRVWDLQKKPFKIPVPGPVREHFFGGTRGATLLPGPAVFGKNPYR